LKQKKGRVLVVDDEASVRAVHARYVEHLGYEAELAGDGIEALAKLALGIDLVLLDIHMPVMDGFEVAAQIRAHPTHRLIPIIMITGANRAAWYPRALEVGANDVIGKPIDSNELRLRTRWLMELKHAHDTVSQSNVRLAQGIERATGDLRKALDGMTEARRLIYDAHLDTIRRLTIAAEYRDETIAGHLARVGKTAEFVAHVAGLPASQVELLEHAAPLHDVGMIGIPDQVLLKAGPLDEVELALVREHTHIGATLLAGSTSDVIQMGATIALYHHEHWDGGGYPERLIGDAIPIEARICALVDFYDSSTMHRPYRRARPSDVVVSAMREESGRRFEPRLLDAFIESLPMIKDVQAEYPIE
jgi:putative two-component system response regulator